MFFLKKNYCNVNVLHANTANDPSFFYYICSKTESPPSSPPSSSIWCSSPMAPCRCPPCLRRRPPRRVPKRTVGSSGSKSPTAWGGGGGGGAPGPRRGRPVGIVCVHNEEKVQFCKKHFVKKKSLFKILLQYKCRYLAAKESVQTKTHFHAAKLLPPHLYEERNGRGGQHPKWKKKYRIRNIQHFFCFFFHLSGIDMYRSFR